MIEFEVGGQNYRASKMNAFQQFHVARKLGPIFAKLGPGAIRTDGNVTDMLAPIVDALAAMPEEDCNYILHRCLAVVQRAQGNGQWMSIWNENAKRLQFEDLDLTTMMQITLKVLGDNLGNFMNVPSSTTSSLPSQGSNTPENL